MTTHELLGQECLSFTDYYLRAKANRWAYQLHRIDAAHRFLTQPLTPEWVEKYLDVVLDEDGDLLLGSGKWLEFLFGQMTLAINGNLTKLKHPSHLFESLPEGITLNYKNVEI